MCYLFAIANMIHAIIITYYNYYIHQDKNSHNKKKVRMQRGQIMRCESYVKEYREECGYTIRELSKRTGISIGHLSEIENGVKIPTVIMAYRLEKALKRNIWELFKIKD